MTNTKRPLRVFLCHASGDKPTVRRLYKRLVRDGIDAWLDTEKLLPGQEWRLEIPKAVRNSDAVIVCLSQGSINKAGYVQREIKDAVDVAAEQPEGAIFLIPLKLEECDVPDRMSNLQWVDLFSNNGYERLLRALQRRANGVGAIIKHKKNSSDEENKIQVEIQPEKKSLGNPQILVNTSYLAALVGTEQFTEKLPEPYTSSGFVDIQINDVSAAQRLNAVQLKLSIDPNAGIQTSAQIEIYKSKEAALKRCMARRALLIAQYPEGVGLEPNSDETFCVAGFPDCWICAGSRGFAYAEVTLSPGSNANLSLANGILSAMLKYADKMTALATNQPEY